MFGLHSNIRRISQSSSDDESPPPASVGANRVKRALFGPTDHEENLRFVKNELKKARSEASSRWNFDFDSGRPLTGQYDWEEVESTTASRTICNPEKHSLLAPGPGPAQEKENRVVTSCDRVEPGEPESGETRARPDVMSRVSPETPGAGGLVTPDSGEASPPPPGPSAASTDSSSLGARHKTTLSKEKKLTGILSCHQSGYYSHWPRLFLPLDYYFYRRLANRIFLFFPEIYRSRKPRSKSSSSLRKIKRLGHDGGGGARSPSVKSRGTSISKDKDLSVRVPAVSTGQSQDDSNSD